MNKSYNCRYAMYLHHNGIKSSIHGENLIDAIKNRNQTAILVWVEDEDGQTYIAKEHDEPNKEGYFNYYWINEVTGELLYDDNNDIKEPLIINPISVDITTSNSGWIDRDGLFYECGFEQHGNLAESLLKAGIVKPHMATDNCVGWVNMETVLECRGWVKISSNDVRYRVDRYSTMSIINKAQKETIIAYFIAKKKSKISVFDRQYTIEEFLNEKF